MPTAAAWQALSVSARKAIHFAHEEAARYGENYVGTEHLLLALVRERVSTAARILEELQIGLNAVRTEVEQRITRGQGNLNADMQLTPRAERVIGLAHEEAREQDSKYIGTEHLLLALVIEGDGIAARVLLCLGADIETIRDAIRRREEAEEDVATNGGTVLVEDLYDDGAGE